MILPELHVETEQRITLPPTEMGFRHMEHMNAGLPLMSRCLPQLVRFLDARAYEKPSNDELSRRSALAFVHAHGLLSKARAHLVHGCKDARLV